MKRVVLFGSGTVAEKNLNLRPAFIVDNNPDLHGTFFHGVEVKSPSILRGASDEYKVVVCTTSISEVKRQLQSYGYDWGSNAQVASLLEERLELAALEDERFKFLISSGLPSSAQSFSGGGIYLIEETDSFPKFELVYSGNTHGLIKTDSGYLFSCQGSGLVFLDENFNVAKTIALRSGLRPHGVCRYKDLWVFASSYTDALIGVNNSGEEVFEYRFSEKKENLGSAQHHCNDVTVEGNYAYVSMFSLSGNWKRNSFDGGIMEVNLETGKMQPLIGGLTMPHNVQCNVDGFRVLNSFEGTFLDNNFEVVATLPGFARGLFVDDDYYYIGESKNRNFSRLDAKRSPVSIDARITIINRRLGFSRSIAFPKYISEIHAILKL